MTPTRLVAAVVFVAALVLAVGAYIAMRPSHPTGSAPLPRSGPISTYPAAWGIYSSCPGFASQGNITTLAMGNIGHPNGWNTTTVVTLAEVYHDMVSSPAFMTASSGHGWVVYSWSFTQGGGSNDHPFANADAIMGYFILTNGVSPNGYVTAYYNIQDGAVALDPVTTTFGVVCPTTTTSG